MFLILNRVNFISYAYFASSNSLSMMLQSSMLDMETPPDFNMYILLLQVRVGLGVMAVKGYLIFWFFLIIIILLFCK